MVKGFERRAKVLEDSFEIDLIWRRSHVYTVDLVTYNELFNQQDNDIEDEDSIDHSSETTFLIIDSFCDIENYDALTELPRLLRPDILVILGLICFTTGIPLTPFSFHDQIRRVVEPDSEKFSAKPSVLKLDGDDYSASLTELVESISSLKGNKQILIFSLLDRWRKAKFLQVENSSEHLYDDETVLASFHILELIGGQYGDKMSEEADEKIKILTKEILDLFYANTEDNAKKLTLSIQASIAGFKNIKPKILRMLKELNLLEPKSRVIVERFLDHRNAIAHGRVNLYEDQVIYPLKPFFNHMKDIYEDINSILVVSARVIAAYLGTSLWKDEWDEVIENEMPTYEMVKHFNRQQLYLSMSWQELEVGDENGVTVETLIHYYLKDALKIVPFGKALDRYLSEVKLNNENDINVLYVSAILADSPDQIIAMKAREKLVAIKASEFEAKYEMRDILKEMSYQRKEPQYLKAFLIEQAEQKK